MSHIMISYSRKDKDCAYKLQRQLEAQGFKVWIDKHDIPAGAPFPLEILQAIRTASAVLILWSQHSSISHFVGKEIEEAITQKMMRSIPVIPVWLDGTPLRPELESLNAFSLTDCANDGIDRLVKQLALVRYRHVLPFDPQKSLQAQGAKPLQHHPSLVALPILDSVYCKGRVIAAPNMSLAAAKNHPSKAVQVFLEFLGKAGSEDSIGQIVEALQASQPDTPFFLFHFTGHEVDDSYQLTDDPSDSPHGDWLDAVNAIHLTLDQLVGRGSTIQLGPEVEKLSWEATRAR